MNDRSALKRKLEELDSDARVIRERIRKLDQRTKNYEKQEYRIFLASCLERATNIWITGDVRIDFEHNMLGAYVSNDCTEVELFYFTCKVAHFYPEKRCEICHIRKDQCPEIATVLALLSDIFPEIVRLTNEILPAWLEASKDVDWESLATTRVLWWISKELPGSCWADVIEGNLIKMF